MRATSNRTLTPLLVVFAMLGVACSRVPPGGELSIGDGGGAAQVDTTGEAPGVAFPDSNNVDADGSDTTTTGNLSTSGGSEGGATAGSATTDGGSSSSTGGSSGGSDSGGSDTGTATTTGGTKQPTSVGSGPGVDGNVVKVVFHGHFEDCPQDDNEPNDNVRQKGKRVINEYAKFFNEYVLKEHGWQLEVTILDDGGYFCPERQRATALKIAEEIKPFAVVGESSSAQGPIVADVVTRAGIIHAGGDWGFAAEEKARHPYAWSLFPSDEKAYQFFTGWLAKRIKGTQVPDRVTGTGQMVDRVYGILGVDYPKGRQMTKYVRDRMEAAGIPVAQTYLINADPGVASQQATNLVAKMRSDGVNSLVFGVGQGAGNGSWNAPFVEAMNSQNYLPDVLLGGPPFGNAFFMQLLNDRVWEHAKGTSPFPAVALRVAVEAGPDGKLRPSEDFDAISENSDAYTEAWAKLGHSDNPQEGSYPSGFGTWTNFAFLAAGIIHAGDTLNAHTFAQGLESAGSPNTPNRCTMGRLMGRDYRFVARYEWNAEHDGGAEGFTTIYWVNKPNGLSSGYYESYDNYVAFTSPDSLTPQPSRDTGKDGYDIPKQERIGIKPWSSCSEFPNYPPYRETG